MAMSRYLSFHYVAGPSRQFVDGWIGGFYSAAWGGGVFGELFGAGFYGSGSGSGSGGGGGSAGDGAAWTWEAESQAASLPGLSAYLLRTTGSRTRTSTMPRRMVAAISAVAATCSALAVAAAAKEASAGFFGGSFEGWLAPFPGDPSSYSRVSH